MAVLVRQEQRQTLTQRIDPKLIMANAILQQSSMELLESIEAELLQNPALDVLEHEPVCNGNCRNPDLCPVCSQRTKSVLDDTPVDVLWTDAEAFFSPQGYAETEFDLVANLEAEVTLQEHLTSLLRAALTDEEFRIGEYIVNSLNSYGWLDVTPEEIARDLRVEVSEVLRVLEVAQSMDPPGVAARDLRECMTLQLRYLAEEGQGHSLAQTIVDRYFKDMVRGRHGKIARALGVSPEQVKDAVRFIRERLNPYPASQFRPPWATRHVGGDGAIKPDVVIRRTELGYEVEVVGSEPFVLGVNPTYRRAYDAIQAGSAQVPEEDRRHITEYVERAELFIRNLNQRRKTLRMITRCIVEQQQGYLETGSRQFLVPLTRTRVAELLNLHESTVSRATAKKYVQLPNEEVVPFDIFFNSSLSVKEAIEELIANEDPSRPLSDQQIVAALRQRNIMVARRTVVKYRESQKILSSSRRRR